MSEFLRKMNKLVGMIIYLDETFLAEVLIEAKI